MQKQGCMHTGFGDCFAEGVLLEAGLGAEAVAFLPSNESCSQIAHPRPPAAPALICLQDLVSMIES